MKVVSLKLEGNMEKLFDEIKKENNLASNTETLRYCVVRVATQQRKRPGGKTP